MSLLVKTNLKMRLFPIFFVASFAAPGSTNEDSSSANLERKRRFDHPSDPFGHNDPTRDSMRKYNDYIESLRRQNTLAHHSQNMQRELEQHDQQFLNQHLIHPHSDE